MASSPYQWFRCKVKKVLRNQQPSGYSITEAQLAELHRGAGLRKARRLRTTALNPQAMVVVAEPLRSELSTVAREFTVRKAIRSDMLDAHQQL